MVKGGRVVVPWVQLTTLGSVVKVRAPGWSDPAGQNLFFAEVAELVDALASGASGGNPVEVQVRRGITGCHAKGSRRTMVAFRSGPVEIIPTGTSSSSDKRSR